MAKVQFGAAVQDMRGSLNGSVYSRNKGGAYIRTKVSPVQPRTAAQLKQRQIFSTNAKAWSGTLTQDQRTAWSAFAVANPLTNVFGAAITISGLAAYQQLNAVLGTIGEPTISDPPADKSVVPLAAPSFVVADASADTVIITTAEQATEDASLYYIFATPLLAPGVTPNQSTYRFIGTGVSTTAGTTVSVTSQYINKFGSISAGVGKRLGILVAFVNVASGAVTIGQKFETFVTA